VDFYSVDYVPALNALGDNGFDNEFRYADVSDVPGHRPPSFSWATASAVVQTALARKR
jgi:hypothetical protein